MPHSKIQPSFVSYTSNSPVSKENADINQGSYKQRTLVANAGKKTALFFSKVTQWVKENVKRKFSAGATTSIGQISVDPLTRYNLKSTAISSIVNAKKSENKAVQKSLKLAEKAEIKEENANWKAEVKAKLQTDKNLKKFDKMSSRAILMAPNSDEAFRALDILKARFADGIDKSPSTRL
jgi:hypothetical protein